MVKLLLLLLGVFKFGKLGGTAITMLLSLAVYAASFGWMYAAGFVLLLFCHEMGHFLAARQRGLVVGAPTFIPFVGAWIQLKEQPLDVETEAYVAMAGPLVGTASAAAFYFWGRHAENSLLLAIAWTLPSEFQVWGGLIGAVTSATVFTYMPGPITLGAFRQHLPDLQRPFRLPVAAVISPLAFVASTLLIYWSGWSVNEILIPILIVAWVAYAIFGKKSNQFSQDLQCAWWLLAYYIAVMVIYMLGIYGGSGMIEVLFDMILIIVALLF